MALIHALVEDQWFVLSRGEQRVGTDNIFNVAPQLRHYIDVPIYRYHQIGNMRRAPMRSVKNISSLIEKGGITYLKDTIFLRLRNRIRKLLTSQEFRQIPRMLHIETTSLCNLDCEYCELRKKMPEKTTLKLSEFRLLMPYVRHADAVFLSGMAEPLMNRNIAKFIRYIKSENSRCEVYIDSNADRRA